VKFLTSEEQLLIKIQADTTNLQSGLKAAGTGLDNFALKISSIGKGMTIVGAAITAGFAMAIKTASTFEQSMANTQSVAGATTEELQRMSDAAREMGKESVYTASQAADAMYYLGSAGLKADQIIGALSGTMSLAAATQSDLAYTSEAITATLSQYNLKAEEATRVANVFAAAISGSQATMVKLKESMTYVGPMAKSMGISLEETAGILMNLYNAGLEGAAAGTALRMAFAKLLDPTKDTADAMGRLKVNITDSAGQMRPFKDIIDDLGRAGMTAADAMQIFGIRAGPGMLALVSQGEGAIEKMTEKVTDTNKAAEMAAIQMDTFKGAVKLLTSGWQEFQIIIANHIMPTITLIVKGITWAINAVSAWMERNTLLTDILVKLGAGIGALCVVGGPILMAVASFGLLKGVMVKVATYTTATFIPNMVVLKTSITGLGTASTGPIGIAIIALGAIVIGVIKLSDYLRETIGGMRDFRVELNKMSLLEIDTEIKTLTDSIEQLQKRVKEIPKGIGQQEALTILDEMNKRLEMLNKKREGLVELAKGVDNLGDSIGELGDEGEALAEIAADALAKAIGEIDDRLYELSHTTMEYAIYQLDQQKQAYIDLGVPMSDVEALYEAEIDKLNDLTEARKTLTESMGEVESRIYEMTHTQKENEIKLLNEKKAKLIEIAKQAGLSAKEEIAAIKLILEYYQKELDILNKIGGIKEGKRYNIFDKEGKNIASVGSGKAQQMLEEGYNIMEIPSNTPEQQPGQILTEPPKLATGTPLVKKAGVAIIDKGEAVLTPEQNKAYQAGGKSYTININNPVVRSDDDISKMRQQFEDSINGLSTEYSRSGNYLIPGMA